MRTWASILVLIALPCFPMASPRAAAAGVDCSRAVSTVEQTICQHEDMLKVDREIAHEYGELMRAYATEDLRVFKAGQRAWLVERNDCQNTPTAERYPEGVAGCVRSKMAERVAVLARLRADPRSLPSTVATYTFVEPWYVRRYAREYEGKLVNVVGSVILRACSSPGHASRAGLLREGGASIEIRFKSLSDEDISFLCAKYPSSWWRGTVTLRNGRPSLNATDLLGRDLP